MKDMQDMKNLKGHELFFIFSTSSGESGLPNSSMYNIEFHTFSASSDERGLPSS